MTPNSEPEKEEPSLEILTYRQLQDMREALSKFQIQMNEMAKSMRTLADDFDKAFFKKISK